MKKTTQSELWGLYQSTKFIPTLPFPDWSQFAIVTAYHPLGQITEADKNTKLQQQLMEELSRKGINYWPVVGCSPDRSYQEPSLAIHTDKTTALELARMFKQNAIFWVEFDKLWLIPCWMQGQSDALIADFSQRLLD